MDIVFCCKEHALAPESRGLHFDSPVGVCHECHTINISSHHRYPWAIGHASLDDQWQDCL